jgi:nucleotide-binding universal stress UspA family protein
MFESVLVGSDDSQTARQAVEAAVRMTDLAGGKLHIVTVYDPKSVRKEHLPRELQLSTTTHPADVLLNDLAAMGRERGLDVVVHAATGDPAAAIVRIAEAEGVDLVVVGNKGMKGTHRILGSVPNSVAHSAPCSVLIVDTAGD